MFSNVLNRIVFSFLREYLQNISLKNITKKISTDFPNFKNLKVFIKFCQILKNMFDNDFRKYL